MPQLDFATFVPQLVWLAITFAVLHFIVVRIALPRIGGTIENRSNKIASDLDKAQSLKADLDKAIVDYETALAEAKAKAHAIAQETRDKLAAEIDSERQRVDAEIAEKVTAAEAKIKATKDKAMSNVGKIATDLAAAIVTDLTGSKTTAAAAKKAVDARAAK